MSLKVTSVQTEGVELPINGSTVSASGSIAAGFRAITFIPRASFAGTILGQTFASTDAAFTITAPPGCTLGPISYTRSAGTLTILTIG